jgi:hypothetical protein
MAGAPTKYKTEYAEQAYKLCLLGATDKEMADFFQVEEKTINNWKKAHDGFLQSITRGKIIADAEIADSLYQRAKGYVHTDTKFAIFQGAITETMEYMKHYPPDTEAAKVWLKNRQPSKWRDKQEIEHSGDMGVTIIKDDIKSK